MLKRRVQTLADALQADWRGPRVICLGLVVLLASSLVVLAYYLNHPMPETYPDTPTYLAVSQHIMSSGKLVDTIRLPGYPLLLTLAFLVAGQGNLLAASIIQGALFVVAACEVYVITYLLTRRAWMALVVGLLIGTNIILLSYSKPILSEGFSLWMVTSLALALTLFLHTWRMRYFWLMVVFLLICMMTRPEWTYAAIVLFALLALLAFRRGRLRRLLPHVLIAALALYALLGLYIYGNSVLNGFAGVTDLQPANLLGKVLQYDMQNEAPPQYAAQMREADAFVATGSLDPNGLAAAYPEFAANHWALANDYSTAIVKAHPVEFALKTTLVFFTSSSGSSLRSFITSQGPFAKLLFLLQRLSVGVLALFPFFPFVGLVWLALLFWRRTARQELVELMAGLSVIGLYELTLISLGGYTDYFRLHTAFDPVMFVVVSATLLLALPVLARWLQRHAVWNARLARLWPGICWAWGGLIAALIIAAALATLLTQGGAALLHLHTWSGYALVVDHPLLPALLAGLLALSLYCAYQARRFQASAEQVSMPEPDPAPEQAAALSEPSSGD